MLEIYTFVERCNIKEFRNVNKLQKLFARETEGTQE